MLILQCLLNLTVLLASTCKEPTKDYQLKLAKKATAIRLQYHHWTFFVLEASLVPNWIKLL